MSTETARAGGSTDSATQTLSQSYLLGWMGSITEISSGKLLNAIIFAVFSTPPPHIPLYAIQYHHPPPREHHCFGKSPHWPPFSPSCISLHKLPWLSCCLHKRKKVKQTFVYSLSFSIIIQKSILSRKNILVFSSSWRPCPLVGQFDTTKIRVFASLQYRVSQRLVSFETSDQDRLPLNLLL